MDKFIYKINKTNSASISVTKKTNTEEKQTANSFCDSEDDCDDPMPMNSSTSVHNMSETVEQFRSNLENDNDINDKALTPLKKRICRGEARHPKHVKQLFSHSWETNPLFSKWLSSVEGDKTKARCKVCNVLLASEVSSLKKHNNSIKHTTNMKSVSSSSDLRESLRQTTNPLNEKVKSAEIKIAAFVAEHNISFSTMDHLSDLLKNCFTDSEIAKNINLKRTKTSCIVKNVIGKAHKENLVDILKNTMFSILTDESTDISCVKQSCIVVRYFNPSLGKICSHFYELSPIFDPKDYNKIKEGATGKNLYESIVKSFTHFDIPLENVIGFGSDGCNSMMGSKNSVMSRMIEHFPGIVIMKCICHSLHLCASEACKQLPKRCEDLARNIYSYFAMSSKRTSELMQFQEFCEVKVHKLLHPSQTCWLSLSLVVNRVLEQWQPLMLFFTDKVLVDRITSVEHILSCLNDPLIKLFFMFLEWVLPKFTSLNSYFQSSKVVICELHEKMSSIYKDLLLSYMNPSYINHNELHNINPENEKYFLTSTQIYLGIKVLKELQKPEILNNTNLLNNFYERVLHFLKVSCLQIKKRYNFNDPILCLMKIFKPKIALSITSRQEYPSLFPIMSLIPRITKNNENFMQKVDDEWRLLPNLNIPENIKNIEEPDIFWNELLNLKLSNEDYVLKNVSTFSLSVLSIPHANAECERVFSKVNLIKVKTRNRLNTDTVQGCLFASEEITNYFENCVNFQPTKKMLNSMTSSNIYSTSSNIEDNSDQFSFDS